MPERTIPTLEEIAAGEGHRFDRRTIEAELADVLIVHRRRLDALEVGRSGDGEPAYGVTRVDWLAMRQRAEAAERERDTWEAEFAKLAERKAAERDTARADVERLRNALQYIALRGSGAVATAAADALKETRDAT